MKIDALVIVSLVVAAGCGSPPARNARIPADAQASPTAGVVASAEGSTPSADASAAVSVTVFPNVGLSWVIHANLRREPSHSKSIGVGPTPGLKVVRAVPGRIDPELASANAVPIVG